MFFLFLSIFSRIFNTLWLLLRLVFIFSVSFVYFFFSSSLVFFFFLILWRAGEWRIKSAFFKVKGSGFFIGNVFHLSSSFLIFVKVIFQLLPFCSNTHDYKMLFILAQSYPQTHLLRLFQRRRFVSSFREHAWTCVWEFLILK